MRPMMTNSVPSTLQGIHNTKKKIVALSLIDEPYMFQ